MRTLALALAPALALVSLPAAAALTTTTFDFTASGGATGSGTLSAVDEGGYYLVTGMTGTFNGDVIEGIVNPGDVPVIDDVLRYPSTPVLTSAGLAFTAGGQIREIWYNGQANSYRSFTYPHADSIVSIGFSVTPDAGAVPEPASWALMISGFGLVGGALRTSRRVAALPA